MSNSCESCPSFVKAADTGSVLSRPLDQDICVRFGHILSRSGVSDAANARTKTVLGEACPNWGHAMPPSTERPDYLVAQVSMGDPVAISVSVTRPPRSEADAPKSCHGCEYFIPAPVVKKELGWNHGLCAIKGRLIFTARFLKEASNCADGRRGDPRDTTDGVMLLPAYDSSMASIVKMRRTTAPIDAAAHRQDPRTYPTDKPVTPDEASLCIRAWRQVDDPEGVNEPLFLPIFDGQKLYGFDPRTTYGDSRPDLYVDHQHLLYDLVAEMYEQGKTPILQGGAGVGKTDIATWLAWLCDMTRTRIVFRNDSELEEMIGSPSLVVDAATGQTVTDFKVGILPTAITKPGFLMLDEYNCPPDSILQVIRSLLDGDNELKVGDRTFTRNPLLFMLGAQNPPHDPIYRGANVLSAADFNRVTGINVELPPESVERKIIAERCADFGYDIDPMVLDKIMQVSTDIRRQIAEGTLMLAWGVRSNIDVAIKTRFYSFEKSYRRAILDLLEPQVADIIVSSVRSVA